MRTKSSNWFAAMLRKSLRSIFPLRVFGSAGAQWITSGIAKDPICSKNQKNTTAGESEPLHLDFPYCYYYSTDQLWVHGKQKCTTLWGCSFTPLIALPSFSKSVNRWQQDPDFVKGPLWTRVHVDNWCFAEVLRIPLFRHDPWWLSWVHLREWHHPPALQMHKYLVPSTAIIQWCHIISSL